MATHDSCCICSPQESFACSRVSTQRRPVSSACSSVSSGWRSTRSSANLLLISRCGWLTQCCHSVTKYIPVTLECVSSCVNTLKLMCVSVCVTEMCTLSPQQKLCFWWCLHVKESLLNLLKCLQTEASSGPYSFSQWSPYQLYNLYCLFLLFLSTLFNPPDWEVCVFVSSFRFMLAH